MNSNNVDVVIVGAGLAGLSCARHLAKSQVSFVVIEADERIGGRLKTDPIDGFTLNHGFQVLQTAYPEARRQLDYDLLELKAFAAGAMIRVAGKFYRISDPRRCPRNLEARCGSASCFNGRPAHNRTTSCGESLDRR